jgi:hypothetical protein
MLSKKGLRDGLNDDSYLSNEGRMAKIAEQRVAEARDVIRQKEAQPKIGETAMDLLRSRFNDNIKPKAT